MKDIKEGFQTDTILDQLRSLKIPIMKMKNNIALYIIICSDCETTTLICVCNMYLYVSMGCCGT